jgi:trehalose 6-phosphate synthase
VSIQAPVQASIQAPILRIESSVAREAQAQDARDAHVGHDAKHEADRLIIVSNRGPVEHCFGADGAPLAQRGPGGVVSGLLAALGDRPTTWISLAMTDADRVVAAGDQPTPAPRELGQLTLRLVDTPADRYRRYYEGISNHVLWFAQHYLLKPMSARLYSKRTARDWRDYRAVNDAVAEATLAELRAHPGALALFQDYHLYLAPERVRAAQPNAQLAQFVHIPWPEARYWELLPEEMTRAIFRGLASNDVVGFQTERDAANFRDGALRFLEGAELSPCESPLIEGTRGECGMLRWQKRRILVRAYPIAVQPIEVRKSAATPEAGAFYDTLRGELGLDDLHRLIVRVDRVEPTKNIVRGFQAFERLLAAHQEHRGRVTFLALLVPSRQHMAEYRAYERRVRAAIERVNARFGRSGWQPIVAIWGNDRDRALACMRRYDVLLVNPLIDGMNLVVKEGGLVNARGGVVILSRAAGAYEQLADYVLGVAPADVAATAKALHTALTMPPEKRAARARDLRNFLREDDARLWLDAQLHDLRALTHPATPLPAITSRGIAAGGSTAKRAHDLAVAAT